MPPPSDLLGARLLGEKIQRGKFGDQFTARDVYRHGWTGLTDTETCQRAADVLVALHWLSPQEVRPPVGRPQVQYHVNPKVWAGQ